MLYFLLSLINYQSIIKWFIGGIVGKYKCNSNPLYFSLLCKEKKGDRYRLGDYNIVGSEGRISIRRRKIWIYYVLTSIISYQDGKID